MRLQLGSAEINDYAANAEARLPNWDEASWPERIQAILTVFRENEHNPFTRRDINAIVDFLFPDLSKAEDTKKEAAITAVLKVHANAVPATKGYYEHPSAPSIPLPPANDKVDPIPEEPTTVPTVNPPAPPVAPRPPVALTEGVAWVYPTVNRPLEGYYGEDAFLRQLAVTESSCFGNYLEIAPECGACPLAALCASASRGKVLDLAKKLDEITIIALAKSKEKPAAAATPEPTIAARPDPIYPPGSKPLESPFEALCSACNKTLPKNSWGIHVSGKGILHNDCARIN